MSEVAKIKGSRVAKNPNYGHNLWSGSGTMKKLTWEIVALADITTPTFLE